MSSLATSRDADTLARPRPSHPAIPAVGSAFLLWLAYPPVDRGSLAWVALIPFFLLVRSDRRPLSLYLSAWMGGLVFGVLSLSWIAEADVVGMGFMALFLSLWWPIFLLPARIGVRRFGLPLMVVAPAAWVGLEYARAHLLSGFPWYYLAHSQYLYLPVIQMCDLAGAWGLSLLIAMINACGADLLTTPLFGPSPSGPRFRIAQITRLAIAIGLIAAMFAYGGFRLASPHFRPGPRVALLQTDFPQALKNQPKLDLILGTLGRLIRKALAATPPPDLIVWPETSYPVGVIRIDPSLSESALSAQARRIDRESSAQDWRDRRDHGMAELRGLAEASACPMVIGTTTFDFTPDGPLRYNSAALFEPRKPEPTSYHKQALVPFGEYIPFLDALPWLLKLTPYTDGYVPSLTHGAGPQILTVDGVHFAPIICFEDTIPHVVRAFFTEAEGPRPDVLLNLTNDGWFRGTAEHRAHLAISVFRAVESRTPMVRAVNTGISALIDGSGRIRDSLPCATSGALTVSVPLDGRPSPYLLGGDWLPLGCLAITLGVALLPVVGLRRTPRLAQGDIVG